MNLDIRQCEPDELPFIVDRLDQEFILGKQRSLSLSKRFPNTLSVVNIENIRVAVSDGVICGVLSIRMFEWVVQEHAWHGAMIGMVWVDSQHRGKGIGYSLLSSATQFLHETDVDFGVLWTGTKAFYERAGWFSSDRGLLGEAVNRPFSLSGDAVSCRTLTSVDTTWLENLRSRLEERRVVRSVLDYHTVPIPAVHIFCFSTQGDDGSEGFALVGELNGTGYLYEMVAPPACWDTIWTAVAGRFERLFVNGRLGDTFTRWLSDRNYVSWQPQNKTMWLRVSGRVEGSLLNRWHIPYFDWI